MMGGLGDDTYVVGDVRDVVLERPGEGNDTVLASIDYVLTSDVENLTLTGTLALSGTGNGLDNVITGSGAANRLDGGAGNDRLNGGAGNDTLIGGAGLDTFILLRGGGIDTVIDFGRDGVAARLDLSAFLSAGLTPTLTQQGADVVISFSTGEQFIWQFTRLDNLLATSTGYSFKPGQTHFESGTTFALPNSGLSLTLTGSAAINGTGNALNNTIIGNSGANVLDGGGGADQMTGGLGDDTYIVDNIGDTIVELADQGYDRVIASVNWTLGAQFEAMTLSGSAVAGVGNELNNQLLGNGVANVLNGMAGADVLNGYSGDDTLTGGAGVDTFQFSLWGGHDIITDFGLDRERDLIDISQFLNSGVVPVLTQQGSDVRISLSERESVTVRNVTLANFAITSTGYAYVGQPSTFSSATSFTLPDGGLNLPLTGAAAINGTGNALNNLLTGNAGANILDGGLGADRMIGGLGNDAYLIDNTGDEVVELANEGYDRVQSTISYTLTDHVEALTLTGTGAINGTGNALGNQILGNSGVNILDGAGGSDVLNGYGGNDTYIGGTGVDVFQFNRSNGQDVIADFGLNGEADRIDISQFLTSGVTPVLTQQGSEVLIRLSSTDTIRVLNTSVANLLVTATGFTYQAQALAITSDISFVLPTTAVQLTLTGTASIDGTGNDLNNILIGNAGANRLDGGAGADEMAGGLGNDAYIVDNTQDRVIERANEGYDRVQSTVSYTLSDNVEALSLVGAGIINGTGNGLANQILGNNAANILDGAGGADTINGYAGNDTYIGGAGADVFQFNRWNGLDVISDLGLNGEGDQIDISGWKASGLAVTLTQQGSDVLIAMSATETILVRGVQIDNLRSTSAGYVYQPSPASAPSAPPDETKYAASKDAGPHVLPSDSDDWMFADGNDWFISDSAISQVDLHRVAHDGFESSAAISATGGAFEALDTSVAAMFSVDQDDGLMGFLPVQPSHWLFA